MSCLGQSYSGHDGRVTSVCFSLNKKVLLSSSTDGTAMVWTSNCTDTPAVIISHTKRAPVSSSSSSSSLASSGPSRTRLSSFSTYTAAIAAVNNNKTETRNRPFGAEINAVRFFYRDKFIMLVSTVRTSALYHSFDHYLE